MPQNRNRQGAPRKLSPHPAPASPPRLWATGPQHTHQIDRTNRGVAQATSLCRRATSPTEREDAPRDNRRYFFTNVSPHSAGPVAQRNGLVARSSPEVLATFWCVCRVAPERLLIWNWGLKCNAAAVQIREGEKKT